MTITFFFFENEAAWLCLGNNHLFKKVHFTVVVVAVVVVIKHICIFENEVRWLVKVNNNL